MKKTGDRQSRTGETGKQAGEGSNERARKRQLLAPERHALILQYLRDNDVASLTVLTRLTGSSESTIRRDLLELSARNDAIRRTHGGAVSGRLESSTYEPPAKVAEQINVQAKRQIGQAAAELIGEGQCVMFDSGTTVMEAARAAVRRGIAMTAVTNDLAIAQMLNAAPQVRVIVTGGTARPHSNTLYGSPGETLLRTVHVDLLFLGVHAVSETGLTESSMEIAEMKRRMIDAAGMVVLLADESKFGRRAFARICDLKDIHAIMTDAAPPAPLADSLRELGIPVHLAPAAAASHPTTSSKAPK
jgi:DeoR family transcriptional regulator of aga operon